MSDDSLLIEAPKNHNQILPIPFEQERVNEFLESKQKKT